MKLINLSIRNQFILFYFIVSFFPMVILGGIIIISGKNEMIKNTEKQLEEISLIKQNLLSDYIENIRSSLKSLAINSDLIKSLKNYYSEMSFTDSISYEKTKELLKNHQEQIWGKIHHVFIANIKGEVIISPTHGNATTSHLGMDIKM